MLGQKASLLLAVVRHTLAFAASAAAAGALLVFVGVALQGIDPSQRELALLLMVMFALYSAGLAAAAGAVAGFLYALVPARARDIWIAMALGGGVVVAANVFLRAEIGQSLPPPGLASMATAVAVASAVTAWLIRPKRPQR